MNTKVFRKNPLADVPVKKIWLKGEAFWVDDEQLEIINTKRVDEDGAYEFVTTGKKNQDVVRAMELAEKEKVLPPAAVNKKMEDMINEAIEKGMAKLMQEYNLVKKK